MKSSQGLVKFVIGYWTCPRTTSVYTKEKNCHSDHGVRGPQKTYVKAFLIHQHGPMGFAVGEGEEVLWSKETRAHGKETLFPSNFIILFFRREVMTKEDKITVKFDFFF